MAFGDKYRIFINGEQRYFASTELVSFLPKLYLFDNQHSRAKLIMRKKWSWFNTKYKITLWDRDIIEFTAAAFWSIHYQCQDGGDLYDVYGHKGRKHSVYRNGVQIAWWDKEMVSWFDGDNYRVIADDDSNYELVMAFCLMLDNKDSSSDNGSTVTVDFGNIGPQAKEFDYAWRPKQS
ncbi:hypothetical protein ACMA1I_16120 [Pontibacter sp. 13R65]|uniref:hypothetical protein n=1 Tax=Pontibacter sp. 13R65 TaxID=3127458 RepID=UPI00301D4CB9